MIVEPGRCVLWFLDLTNIEMVTVRFGIPHTFGLTKLTKILKKRTKQNGGNKQKKGAAVPPCAHTHLALHWLPFASMDRL